MQDNYQKLAIIHVYWNICWYNKLYCTLSPQRNLNVSHFFTALHENRLANKQTPDEFFLLRTNNSLRTRTEKRTHRKLLSSITMKYNNYARVILKCKLLTIQCIHYSIMIIIIQTIVHNPLVIRPYTLGGAINPHVLPIAPGRNIRNNGCGNPTVWLQAHTNAQRHDHECAF